MGLRWKVCGITGTSDALAAVEAGADAIGFVFYPESLRAIRPETAACIAAALPAETWRVGVFVDGTVEEMSRTVEQVGLDFLQLHGDEPPEICRGLSRHAFKALRLDADMGEPQAQALADRYPECTLLVDTASADLYGGTGRPANWSAAAHLAKQHRLILAGGLDAANVAAALDAVAPWAVDVSSGVESSPGVKDHDKLRDFAAALEPYR